MVDAFCKRPCFLDKICSNLKVFILPQHVEDKVSKKFIQKFQVGLRLADQSEGPTADENFVVLESVAKTVDENDKTIAEEKRISRNTLNEGAKMPVPKSNHGEALLGSDSFLGPQLFTALYSLINCKMNIVIETTNSIFDPQ